MVGAMDDDRPGWIWVVIWTIMLLMVAASVVEALR